MRPNLPSTGPIVKAFTRMLACMDKAYARNGTLRECSATLKRRERMIHTDLLILPSHVESGKGDIYSKLMKIKDEAFP